MLDNSSLIFLFLNAVAAVCFFTLGFARYGAFLNPITMFSGLWAVVAFGANLGLYDFFTPSVDVNWILIIGAISFCVVCWILENRNAFKVSVDHMTGENDISYNFIVVCAAVAAAFMLPLLGDAFAVILSDGGWSALRLENYNAGSTYRSTFQIYGYEYIAKPITRALVIIGLWAYLAKVQRGGLILLMGLLLSLLGTIVSAGRGDILNVIILGVFAMAMAHKKQSSSNLWQRIMRPRIVVPAIAIAVLVLAITADRHVGDTTIAETFYQYYFSGPVFLSELLRQDNLAWTVGEDYMLGWATFGFLANAPLTLGLVFGLGVRTFFRTA